MQTSSKKNTACQQISSCIWSEVDTQRNFANNPKKPVNNIQYSSKKEKKTKIIHVTWFHRKR